MPPVNGKKCKKIAEKSGFRTEFGKGDHLKVWGPDKSMIVIPYKTELATGTGRAVRNWFLRFGIVVGIVGCVVIWSLL